MKNNFPTFFIQEHPLFFSFSLFNWYLFLAPTLHQSTICLKLSNDYLPVNRTIFGRRRKSATHLLWFQIIYEHEN